VCTSSTSTHCALAPFDVPHSIHLLTPKTQRRRHTVTFVLVFPASIHKLRVFGLHLLWRCNMTYMLVFAVRTCRRRVRGLWVFRCCDRRRCKAVHSGGRSGAVCGARRVADVVGRVEVAVLLEPFLAFFARIPGVYCAECSVVRYHNASIHASQCINTCIINASIHLDARSRVG